MGLFTKKTAIDAPRSNLFLVEPENLVLVTDKNHPLYDERVNWPVDDAMVNNIMWRGVIEPIGVRKNGETLEVVYGRRRVKAACEANLRLRSQGKDLIRIKCEIVRGEDKDLFGVLSSENEHRRDDSPLAKARKAQRMADLGASEQEICLAFGITSQTLRNWQAMLDLSAPVKNAIERGEIKATAALGLAKLPAEEQAARLEEMKAAGGKVTVTRAKRVARGGDAKPAAHMKSRKEITETLNAASDGSDYHRGYTAALRWVLGE
jgi:ParB family chromosome partitioning protein